MQIFFVLHYNMYAYNMGKTLILSMMFKRQKQDQIIRRRICEPWLDKQSDEARNTEIFEMTGNLVNKANLVHNFS